MSRLSKLLIFAAALALACGPAHGQQKKKKPPQVVKQEQPQPPAPPPPPPEPVLLAPAYEAELLRLSEVLGSLHYLRELCGAKEAGLWREQMEAILAAEEPTPERRQMLVANFNRGYRGFREIYRECTPTAAEAANRYLKQGVRLAEGIPGRFGN